MKIVCEKHPNAFTFRPDCRKCGGSGELDDPDDWESKGEECWRCKGSGLEPYYECQDCLEELYEQEN